MPSLRFQITTALAAAFAANIACVAPAAAGPETLVEFDLPAQPLGEALREVSVRTGVGIIVPSDLVARRMAGALRGRFTAGEAAARLIAGTGLVIEQVGGSLVVSARVRAGEFRPSDAGEDSIVVTGTNLRGGAPTSQVLVIGRGDIDASGASSVEQLMGKLPQNAQSGVNRENFRAPGAGADPTDHGAGLNLRGLGQRGTLVLLNGRRIAASGSGSFVDISLIPLSAVERVEILTDGASAIYGSDAVGGVVNFILRRGFEGLDLMLQAGSATHGDGDLLQAAASAGTAWGSGSAMLSYEYRAEDEILARDRDFTINLAPDTSLLPRERRHSLFGNVRQELAGKLEIDLTGFYSARDTDRSYFVTGSPVPVDTRADAQTAGGSFNLGYDLGADWLVQFGGGYSMTATDQRQSRPGAQGLVNDRTTRNAAADIGLKLGGNLADLPAGPLRVALGIEGRREAFREHFVTRTVDLPIEGKREVGAAFLEAQLPIVSSLNRREGLERLILTAAGRYEHYDSFGSTFNPKLGLLWSPTPGMTFRASYDTSFRAPLLSEKLGAYSAIYVPAALVHVDPGQAGGVALVTGGSNPDVQPERSRSWTVGAEFAPPPVPTLSLAVNYYTIRFSDRIALPSPTITVVGDPAFESIVSRDPDDEIVRSLIAGAQTVIDISGPGFSNGGATPGDVTVIVDGRVNNTAVTRTQGLDFNLRYGFSLGSNQFRLDANANYILSFVDQLRQTSAQLDALDTPYQPLDLRVRAHLGWERGGWSANLYLNHSDDYRDNRGNRSLRVGSFTTADLGLAYEFGASPAPWLRGTRIALHAENLFDESPPRLLPDPGSTAGLGYDPVNASGRGRFVSLQLRRTW